MAGTVDLRLACQFSVPVYNTLLARAIQIFKILICALCLQYTLKVNTERYWNRGITHEDMHDDYSKHLVVSHAVTHTKATSKSKHVVGNMHKNKDLDISLWNIWLYSNFPFIFRCAAATLHKTCLRKGTWGVEWEVETVHIFVLFVDFQTLQSNQFSSKLWRYL